MRITFQTESFDAFWPDAAPLLLRHWEEIALKDLNGPLDVDVQMYRNLDAAGVLHITTARDDGNLVGYAVYFLTPNLHYRSLLTADADVFFLVPEYRRGLTGLHLLKAAERALSSSGVTVVMQKTKVAHDCGALFRRMGYAHVENLWMKKVN